MADVAIAGAGPAGTTLAILLGRRGLSVDVFDTHRFPREKPCGEGIMPAGVAVLVRMGVVDAVGGRRLPAVRYHGFGGTAESGFPAVDGAAPPAMLAQRRLRLDDALVAAARATPGVRVFEDAPVDGAVVEGGRAVGLRVGGDVRRAALVVGADGLGSRVRRSLGLDGRARRGRAGIRAHFRLAAGRPAPTRLEIFLGARRELYVAALPDGEVLVAALCAGGAFEGHARASLTRWIEEEPELRALLDGAERLTDVAGRAPVAGRARAGFAPGAVLLGDAASATDPLTAGGIAHALVTAERLAAHVPDAFARGERALDDALARFDRERRRLLRAHGWLTRGLLALVARPALARATLAFMRAQPRVMKRLLGVAAGI
ncbi:MAG TPA: NAD(P)/FAD-dependent oxidoreductase [Polyangia bacterium]|nr:NAD(P)/FAD-dependent oxidoreductase [Polyangia bacterium]